MSKKPDISKFSQKAPFEVPKDYFDKLPGIIQSRIGIDEEEGSIEVFDSLKVDKKHPFKVPDDYFRDLSEEIHAKTVAKKSSTAWSLNWGQQQAKWALVPAMVALFAVGYFLYNGNQTENFSTEELIAQVSSEDLIAYLESSDISADEILSEVNFDNLELEFEGEETDMLDELDFSNDELDDIMMDFDIDTDV